MKMTWLWFRVGGPLLVEDLEIPSFDDEDILDDLDGDGKDDVDAMKLVD